MTEISLAWKDLSVTTPTSWRSKTSRILLHPCTGFVNKGEMMAVMGPVSAGKSTLLHALALQSLGDLVVTGERYVNGREMSAKTMAAITGLVSQRDLFFGTLTVKEHLTFLSNLMLPSNKSKKEKADHVAMVMTDLGLTKCANTLIGIRGRVKGISGGEMRRLSFASAILADPPLLLLDEPTTGLDSWMAENMVKYMKTLAGSGKVIICVIHQPSTDVFDQFDRVLLACQGRIAFQGRRDEAQSFFERIGLPCPNDFNPADHFIYKLSKEPRHEAEYQARLERITNKFQESEALAKINSQVDLHKEQGHRLFDQTGLDPSRLLLYKANWWHQFKALLWRSWHGVIKEPLLAKIRLLQVIFLSLLVGVLFFGQTTDQAGIQNISGALFWVCLNQAFLNYSGVLTVFCNEIPIFMREHQSGLYRVDTYFITKQLADLPLFILMPTIFMAIFYYMVNFNNAVEHFLIAILITIMVVQAAVGMGIFLSCVSPSFPVALALGPMLMVPLLNLGGFYQNTQSFPQWLVWLKYLSLWYYGNEAYNINQWKDVQVIECNFNVTDKCLHSGPEVLDFFSFDSTHLVFDICMLGVLSVGFRFIGFLALVLKARR